MWDLLNIDHSLIVGVHRLCLADSLKLRTATAAAVEDDAIVASSAESGLLAEAGGRIETEMEFVRRWPPVRPSLAGEESGAAGVTELTEKEER